MQEARLPCLLFVRRSTDESGNRAIRKTRANAIMAFALIKLQGIASHIERI
jgi:hypothetical protein